MTKNIFHFKLHKVFGIVNHPNKWLKWILCVGLTHNACHLSFPRDCFKKIQFTTYFWSMP